MTISEVRIGARVRSLYAFSGVPRGTEGVIDEDYGSGVMVAWDSVDRPLPPGYRQYDDRHAATGLLRDGFKKKSELHLLEYVK